MSDRAAASTRHAGMPAGLTFGILSTFPPTECGLATFSAALGRALEGEGAGVKVVRVADGSASDAACVVGELLEGSPRSVTDSGQLLNECDVVLVQHEYGIYGGDDGDEVLEVLDLLRRPVILIAHTVLLEPTSNQREVLVRACALSDRVVVMSAAARDRLCGRFDVEERKVEVIPHGATLPTPRPDDTFAGSPTILTSGLIGPGKGIERVIDAMADLVRLPCHPRYLIAGKTHPKVLAAEGEAYRDGLIARAARLGLAGSVEFDDEYRDLASMTDLIAASTVVALPYDSADQVTSGVLADAIAAGRPVVATAFPHAVELLGSGAGIVVAHDDADAMLAALRRVLTEEGVAKSMAREARHLAASFSWPVVARAYLSLGTRLGAGAVMSA